jgi:hypothetical protein
MPQKLQHLVRNGGTIVVCASFPPELRKKSKFVILGAAVLLRSFAQSWSLVSETRRIRVNVVSLYTMDSDHDFTGEGFNVSSSCQTQGLPSHQTARDDCEREMTRPYALRLPAAGVVERIH